MSSLSNFFLLNAGAEEDRRRNAVDPDRQRRTLAMRLTTPINPVEAVSHDDTTGWRKAAHTDLDRQRRILAARLATPIDPVQLANQQDDNS